MAYAAKGLKVHDRVFILLALPREVVRATDEQVEYFALQVNDTDTWRQRHYKKMCCVVAPDRRLSEHTMRVLRSQFGQIPCRSEGGKS
jgi:hypothetical protein